MTENASISCRVRFPSAGRPKVLRQQADGQDAPRGWIPRVARLTALAIRLVELIASGRRPRYRVSSGSTSPTTPPWRGSWG